jgi:transposase InsO family protein
MDLRDAIQRIALEWPSYGRPRITAELRRHGWTANPKRVYRILREDNLLCVRKRKFIMTTDSNHGRKIYPNLARQMVLTSVDQLWREYITTRGCTGDPSFSEYHCSCLRYAKS